MNFWKRWVRQPQTLWLRKAFFQLHLWTGIGLGLYVLLISVSGSAIVFRNELYGALFPPPLKVAIAGEPLSKEALKRVAHDAYPDYVVTFVWESKHKDEAVEIWMERNGWKNQRLFDPYTGKDLGKSKPYSITVLAWLSDLHANLLSGRSGREINGYISILVCLLCISGLVVWWPGVMRWKRSLGVDFKSNWKRFNWDLHSAAGFWMFGFLFIWGFTGIYVCIPAPFQALVDKYSPHVDEPVRKTELTAPADAATLLPVQDKVQSKAAPAPAAGAVVDPPPQPRRRRRPPVKLSPGETVLRWFFYLHFGNFAGWQVKALWVVFGLSPVLLFVTGLIMWWNRVLSREARAARRKRVPVAVEV